MKHQRACFAALGGEIFVSRARVDLETDLCFCLEQNNSCLALFFTGSGRPGAKATVDALYGRFTCLPRGGKPGDAGHRCCFPCWVCLTCRLNVDLFCRRAVVMWRNNATFAENTSASDVVAPRGGGITVDDVLSDLNFDGFSVGKEIYRSYLVSFLLGRRTRLAAVVLAVLKSN